MIVTHHQKFLTSIKWNSYEQLYYQGILTLHLVALHWALNKVAYGQQGVTFALIYLACALLNFGFDISIAPFFSTATKNKIFFKKIFLSQLAFQIVLLILAPAFLFVLFKNNFFVVEKISYLGWVNLLLCWLIVITEGIKKSLRTFLHCAFLNIKTTAIEMSMITFFVFFVWGLYFEFGYLSLTTLLFSLVLSSCMAVINLSTLLYTFYQDLPTTEYQMPPSLFKRISTSRFFGYLHQINHQLFSSNFIIPSFAFLLGNKEAGTLTLLLSITYFFKAVLQKTLGSSYEATMSQGKELSLENKQELFNTTAGTTYSALNILAGILFIIVYPLMMYATQTSITKTNILPVYLYMIFIFSENFFTIYEKFFFAEEKTHLFLACNAIMLLLIALTIHSLFSTSSILCLILITSIRFLFLGLLIALSFYYWGIKPGQKYRFINTLYPLMALLSFACALI